MKLSQLYPGDKVREARSGIVFTVAGRNCHGTSGVCLITDKVIAQGAMDAPEPESDVENFAITGNSYYPHSNLHQWLNAEGTAWFAPQHPCDTPPAEEFLALRPTLFDPVRHNAYEDAPGFLARFGEGFRRSILPSRVACVTADCCGIEYIDARVFIPSAAELGLETGTRPEGEALELFRDFRMRYAAPSQDCLAEGAWQPAFFNEHRTFWYWLRTVNPTTPGFCAYVHFVNPYAYKFACAPWMGVRPMLNLSGEAQVEPTGSAFGEYRFTEVSA